MFNVTTSPLLNCAMILSVQCLDLVLEVAVN